MRCRKARKLVSVSSDGELDESRREALETHLSGCPDCQQWAAELSVCTRALNVVTIPELRPGITARVLARLPEERVDRFRLGDWLESLRPGTWAAAAMAVSCGVLMALAMNGDQGVEVAGGMDPAEVVYAQSFDAVPGDSAAARYLAMLQEAED